MLTATLLGLYFKLNLLLAATWLLWLLTKRAATLLGFEISHARQLTVARYLFLAVLLCIPFALLVDTMVPGLLAGFAQPLFIDEFRVVANLDATLAQPYLVGDMTLVPAIMLAMLLLGGLLAQLARLAQQVHRLRAIIANATESKCICGIHVLFSSLVTTPFSTRALGKMHVVLPYQLLDSPRNLRLAVKHELQHMRNRDLEWVILLEAASVFFFWNPAMWLWHNEFDCLQEFACDEALVQDRHVSSRDYGTCLLEVASASSGCAVIASSNMVPKFSFWQNQHSQLKRRILMLANNSRKKYAAVKTLCYVLLAGLGMTQAAMVVFAADNRPDAAPLVRVAPEYPQDALTQKMEGWVHVEFTITENGTVIDPVVLDNSVWLESEDPASGRPDDMFKASALAAVAQWRYDPKVDNGVAVRREGVQTIIRYALQDDVEEAQANP